MRGGTRRGRAAADTISLPVLPRGTAAGPLRDPSGPATLRCAASTLRPPANASDQRRGAEEPEKPAGTSPPFFSVQTEQT